MVLMVCRKMQTSRAWRVVLVLAAMAFFLVVDLLAFPAPKIVDKQGGEPSAQDARHTMDVNKRLDAKSDDSSQQVEATPHTDIAGLEEGLDQLLVSLAATPRKQGSACMQQTSGLPMAQEAQLLMQAYKKRNDCVLVTADYLDLFGRVWGCVVQGDRWVDVCIVSAEGKHSKLKITRMDPDAWKEEMIDVSGREE